VPTNTWDTKLWNCAIDTAVKEIAVQARFTRLTGYQREDYVAACRDCCMAVAMLREPKITSQQGAEMVAKLLAGEI
jgi:hypothetical protein